MTNPTPEAFLRSLTQLVTPEEVAQVVKLLARTDDAAKEYVSSGISAAALESGNGLPTARMLRTLASEVADLRKQMARVADVLERAK